MGRLQIRRPDQPLLQPPGDQFPLVLHAHLAVQGTEGPADTVAAHLPQRGDRGAAVAAGDRQQQLPFLLLDLDRPQRVPVWTLQAALQVLIDRATAMQRQQHSPQQAAITAGLMAEEHINTTTPDPLQSLLRDGLGQNNDEVTTMAAELLAQLEDQLIGTTIGAVVVAEHQDRPGWRVRLLHQVCNRRRRQTAGLKQQHRRGLLMPLGAAGHDGPAFGSQDDLVLQRPQLGAVLINIHSRKTLGHRAGSGSHGGQRAPGGAEASGYFENGG